MKRTGLRLAAGISVLFLLAAGAAFGSTSPRYGGTLRVELQAGKISFDPRGWKDGSIEAARDEKMAALVFDRLVEMDNYGRFQPVLATEWSHDAGFRRWQFILRGGVKFSDGSALGAGDVVAALQPLLPSTQQISASGNAIAIQCSTPAPDLLEELASGRFFVYRAQADKTLLGTGSFIVNDASDGVSKPPHLHFQANENTWSGRPFVDGIDVTLGVLPLRELFDLQLGKADLVELSPDLIRRATQENLRVWTSAPVTLYGLRFDDAQPAAADPVLRQALAVSLDRQTIAGVLLQKQAEPASSLLPQWLSGYAFLFSTEPNSGSAKEIRAALSAKDGSEPLRLRVDAPGDLGKLLGERVAVNARQTSILIQVQNKAAIHTETTSTAVAGDTKPGLHLFAWHYSSLSPRVELDSFVAAMNPMDARVTSVSSSADLEQIYLRERKVIEDREILPLVAVPEFVGIGPNVRDWMPARWGEWHLAEVWLEQGVSGQGSVKPAENSSAPVQTPVPGVKP
jgi:peptide/nickel transport system substrate-binding protein